MHATFARNEGVPATGGNFRAHFPALEPAVPPVADRSPAGPIRHYGDAAGPNWMVIAAIGVVHALLLLALVTFDVIEIGGKAPPPLVVDLLAIETPPPPPPAAPTPEVAPVTPVQPRIVAPPPLVRTPAPPPPIATVAEAPPPQAVVVAPAAPQAAVVAAPATVDLATNLISTRMPRVPEESRRKHEQGTVTLRVTVGTDGAVSAIAVAQSSGFARLDKAALDAVKHWRWSPRMQSGQAVAVTGIIPIPFVLNGGAAAG